MLLRQIIAFSLITLLVGCASHNALKYGTGADNQTQWKQHKDQLSNINYWQIDGKIGVHTPKASGSGTLSWLQRQDYYDIRLSGPLSLGTSHLTGRNGHESLAITNNGYLATVSLETLLEQQTGWKLPVSNLVWWIRGLPAPDSNSRIHLNGDSRPAMIEQDGWQIEYRSYVKQNGYLLPERIQLHSTDLNVKLVIKEWQPHKVK
ncbi:lipoprotein insertase outer membrane protein LolB [Candidatus Pseudomonas adelgestsugas]|uniref:Outer-membrane lipoprotein LolB n=1 Tax=Candidatus Pseudomonas adelgestsugas TaxID=1302376 RepID=A0ABX5R7Y8_9PSED|nr:lipoprotein insertase outer membrane protein LolB [Candidatus Pseudomonas adelgestsugas]QAX81752.1 Outer-membrane lipoprotein LolB precursor [Candidatus Pseudomonas adelgestsugas]